MGRTPPRRREAQQLQALPPPRTALTKHPDASPPRQAGGAPTAYRAFGPGSERLQRAPGQAAAQSTRNLAQNIHASAGWEGEHPEPPIAPAKGGHGKRGTDSTVDRLPRPRGQGGREDMAFGPDRAHRSSLWTAKDRKTAWRPDTSHHTQATRKSHWTWRFTSIPWDRHSSGRKRRSGRRSPSGSPQGDHVKVAGRGSVPATLDGSPPRRASARCRRQDPPPASMRHFGAARTGASVPGRSRRATTTEWQRETLDWQSPWEHRAPDRLQCRPDATDFTVDESPEVERPLGATPDSATRSRERQDGKPRR